MLQTMNIDLNSPYNLATSLRDNNARLVTNIAQGVFGHLIAEIDNYLRFRICEKLDSSHPCVFLGEEDSLTSEILNFYDDFFEAVSLNVSHKKFGDIVANCHPDLTLDVGISSYKVAPPARGYAFTEIIGHTFAFRTGYLNGSYWDHIQYYKRMRGTANLHPMRLETPCPSELRDFVDRNGKPIVIIQQRQIVSAANKIIAVDELYRPALEYINEKGYTLVFVGREVYPESWRELGVIDYANSHFASFQNDSHLFRLASYALLAASGTKWLAEVQDTPFLQINNSQGANLPFSGKSITLPSKWMNEHDGKMCSALEHIRNNLYYGAGSPPGLYAQSVTAQDILEGVQELEILIDKDTPRTPLQQQWTNVGKNLWESEAFWQSLPEGPWIGGNEELLDGQNEECLLTIGQGRVAQKYLEQNQEALFN